MEPPGAARVLPGCEHRASRRWIGRSLKPTRSSSRRSSVSTSSSSSRAMSQDPARFPSQSRARKWSCTLPGQIASPASSPKARANGENAALGFQPSEMLGNEETNLRKLGTAAPGEGGYGSRPFQIALPQSQLEAQRDRLIALCMTQERPKALLEASAVILDASSIKLGAKVQPGEMRSEKIRRMLCLTDELRCVNACLMKADTGCQSAEHSMSPPEE